MTSTSWYLNSWDIQVYVTWSLESFEIRRDDRTHRFSRGTHIDYRQMCMYNLLALQWVRLALSFPAVIAPAYCGYHTCVRFQACISRNVTSRWSGSRTLYLHGYEKKKNRVFNSLFLSVCLSLSHNRMSWH